MACSIRRFAFFASILLVASVGCNLTTGPRLAGLRDLNENPELREQQTVDECEGEDCGPKRYQVGWYEQRAQEPIGARQHYRAGKLWPPYPRPIGDNAQLSHRYHTAHYWPHPYNCQDKAYFKNVRDAQANNGWIAETTLYDYHFDPDTQELTPPGKLHLRWILMHVPEKNRVAWVQTTLKAADSQARLISVREVALELAGESKVPPIMLRAASPTGASADEAVMIRRAWLGSMPAPRIIYTALPTGP